MYVDLRVGFQSCGSSSPSCPRKGSKHHSRGSLHSDATSSNRSSNTSHTSSSFYLSTSSLNSCSSANVLDPIATQTAVVGIVRFKGMVSFASGYWLGIELDEAIGSNDGSVNGTRYFDSRSKHGIFVAPSRVVK